MKKEKNLTFNIVRVCFCIIPLGLSLMFIYFAIKNHGISSIKFYIAAGFLGFIGLLTLISYPVEIIQTKMENKTLEYGVPAKAKIVSAKFMLGSGFYPDVSKNEQEYNNKPICETGKYRIKIAFENENGKRIQKTALFLPLLNKYQLSYLVEKESINIVVYKNRFAFTQEMFDAEIAQMPQDQKVLTLKNDKITIKTGIYLKRTKKLENAIESSTKEYSLYAQRKTSPNNAAQIGEGAYYICKVKYYANVDGERKFGINYIGLREFSRIQANQQANLPLPLLIKDNKMYIDYDNLLII